MVDYLLSLSPCIFFFGVVVGGYLLVVACFFVFKWLFRMASIATAPASYNERDLIRTFVTKEQFETFTRRAVVEQVRCVCNNGECGRWWTRLQVPVKCDSCGHRSFRVETHYVTSQGGL